MKKLIKRTSKVFAILLATVIICVGIYYAYYKYRQNRQYADKITITAYYMRYACGDCSVDMKVKTVDNKDYKFIIGQDVFPTPETKKFDQLCDFIDESVSSTDPDHYDESFTLVGYLHKHSHGLPVFNCSETPYFTVEKIKYGPKGKWVQF
jgi:hypothetical protein